MSKEFKVGVFAIISGVILYLGFNYLKGIDFFSPTNKYYAIYDNIDGLNVSNPVIVNGFSVGRVSNISILQELDNKILVQLDVDENVILGDSTVATLTNSDFLGSKAILLDIGHLANPVEDGDTLIADIDKGIAEFLESAQPLTDNLGITIRRINEILLGLEGAGDGVKNALISLDKTLTGVNTLIAENRYSLKKTIDGFSDLSTNINDKIEKLDPLIANANGTLQKVNALELEETLTNLNTLLSSLNTLVDELNEGKGSMGKILKEDSLYNNLNKTITDLDELLIHFNENPKHFMSPLGKKKKKIEKELKNN